MKAIVTTKEVYGERKIYPVNDIAQNLAKIAGTKTLTATTIILAKNMGIEFEIQYNNLQELMEVFN